MGRRRLGPVPAREPGVVEHPVVHAAAVTAPRRGGDELGAQLVGPVEEAAGDVDPGGGVELDALGARLVGDRRRTAREQRPLPLHHSGSVDEQVFVHHAIASRGPTGCPPPPDRGTSAMSNVPRGRGLAANDRTVLTMTLRCVNPTSASGEESWMAETGAVTEHAVVIAGAGRRADARRRAGPGRASTLLVVEAQRRRSSSTVRGPGACTPARSRCSTSAAWSTASLGRDAAPVRVRRRGDARPQRLPDPPQPPAGAVAERVRADPGRVGRRARRAGPARPRGRGLHPGRLGGRRRALRWHHRSGRGTSSAATAAAAGCARRPASTSSASTLDGVVDRRGRDGRRAAAGHAPRRVGASAR